MRSKSLPVIFLLHYLIILILLLAFGEYAFATKPRKAGIGFKYGYTTDMTEFKGTRNDENTYIATYDTGERINNPGTTHIPIFVQLDENLINEFSFSYWFFDLSRLIQTGHPPSLLEGTSYDDLVDKKTYSVPTENTFTSAFSENYPKYSSVIDNASNPSLSADYYVTKLTFGKTWGVFIPVSDRHRLGSLGVGVGINYIEGNYQINICDPYQLSSEFHEPKSVMGGFREGFCLKKTELYSTKINHFSWEINVPLIIYSYIGETIEFNLGEFAYYHSYASSEYEDALDPAFRSRDFNILKIGVPL